MFGTSFHLRPPAQWALTRTAVCYSRAVAPTSPTRLWCVLQMQQFASRSCAIRDTSAALCMAMAIRWLPWCRWGRTLAACCIKDAVLKAWGTWVYNDDDNDVHVTGRGLWLCVYVCVCMCVSFIFLRVLRSTPVNITAAVLHTTIVHSVIYSPIWS
jgi:hypothetical protein